MSPLKFAGICVLQILIIMLIIILSNTINVENKASKAITVTAEAE